MTTVYIQSTFEDPPEPVCQARKDGRLTIIRQEDLSPSDLQGARGIITHNQLDQNAFLKLKDALEAFLNRGGRWFFNGHFVRPLLDGLKIYQPMEAPSFRDFAQTRLADHPIFRGMEISHLETNKGVGGFYGRGANPRPEGAIAVTGLRQGTVPVDWVWPRPKGGRVFSHAGNDLGQFGVDQGLPPLLHGRIIEWASGGDCL